MNRQTASTLIGRRSSGTTARSCPGIFDRQNAKPAKRSSDPGTGKHHRSTSVWFGDFGVLAVQTAGARVAPKHERTPSPFNPPGVVAVCQRRPR